MSALHGTSINGEPVAIVLGHIDAWFWLDAERPSAELHVVLGATKIAFGGVEAHRIDRVLRQEFPDLMLSRVNVGVVVERPATRPEGTT